MQGKSGSGGPKEKTQSIYHNLLKQNVSKEACNVQGAEDGKDAEKEKEKGTEDDKSIISIRKRGRQR